MVWAITSQKKVVALHSCLDWSGGCLLHISIDDIQVPQNISEILIRMSMSTL